MQRRLIRSSQVRIQVQANASPKVALMGMCRLTTNDAKEQSMLG